MPVSAGLACEVENRCRTSVWIDIDNPPQARYLLPFVRRFEEAGHDVLLTARAYGETFAILRSEDVTFEPIGSSFGKGIPRKLYGLGKRTRQLTAFLERQGPPPDVVVTASRSAAVAASKLGIPSFVIIDYEHVNLLVYRFSGSCIVHPSVIDPSIFEGRGISRERLLPFEGLKEDFTFADVDVLGVAPFPFGEGDAATARVLFRPPAEESHYFRAESRDLALELLRYLAAQDAKIIFSPRYPWQARYLDEVPSWREEPTILGEPIQPVALLTGVDAIVSAGGTMLREAAYLGVSAYSMFRGRIGAVDRHLVSIGRLALVTSPADFSGIELKRKTSILPLREKSTAADDVTTMVLERLESASKRSSRRRALLHGAVQIRRH
jgi:predicted glycosyltransferase